MFKTVNEHIRDDLLMKAGLRSPKEILKELEQSEWSPRFEELMRNRLIMGAFRYGVLHAPGKKRYDRVGRIADLTREYAASGNTECLVDIANLALMEFEEGVHPNKHFSASDDKQHTRVISDETRQAR